MCGGRSLHQPVKDPLHTSMSSPLGSIVSTAAKAASSAATAAGASSATPSGGPTVALAPSGTSGTLQSQIPAIKAALAGGAATSSYFASKAATSALFTNIASGASSWETSTDEQTGAPVMFTGSGNMWMTLSANISSDGSDSSNGSFQFGGVSYNVIGSAQITISADNDDVWTSTIPLGATGVITTGLINKIVQSVITGLMGGVQSGVTAVVNGNANAENADEVVDGADDAAVEGVSNAATDASSAGLTRIIACGGFCMSCLVATLIVMALESIIHMSYHTLLVYNLTPNSVVWSIGYQDEGSPYVEPSFSSTSEVQYTIPACVNTAPPQVAQVLCYYDATFKFVSTNQESGIGYTMCLQIQDANNNVIDTATVMFDIPFDGQNSLACTFGAVDATSFYNSNEGTNQVTTLSATSSDGKYQVTVTYDYLSGEHIVPNSPTQQYAYNSMVVIQSLS